MLPRSIARAARAVRTVRVVHVLRLVAAVGLTGFLFALTPTAEAAPVEQPTAHDAAVAFLHGTGVTTARIDRCSLIGAGPHPLAYVFALEPTGYVAVSGDDALPPVIAYSLESEYPADAGRDNPLARLLAADLTSRLAALSAQTGPASPANPANSEDPANPARNPAQGASSRAIGSEWTTTFQRDERFTQWPPAGTTPTGGWLTANWTQNAPYNALCPLDLAHGGVRSLAGCPAVAMAMILNYHETIHGTTFGVGDRYWHNYDGNAYWIPDGSMQYGFPNFNTLNGYLQTVTQHWSEETPLTNTDKAALTFACGVAARQVYSASVSGTFGVDQAYAAYRRFGFSTCRLVLDTDPQMYPDLAAQMQNAIPAHLAIVDPGWTMGHNVVVDGYNTDDYYHLNFGWGGPYNGWYLLPQEIPYGLTVIEGVILDIVPSITAVESTQAGISSLLLANDPNPFRERVTLSFEAPGAGYARLGIYDVSGRLMTYLLDGDITAGFRSLTWTPNRPAAGVFLARLELGGRVEMRRLVAVR